ncbi:MAG: ROK family protein [Candidatus Protochlamydia sp.]|nr:ROK family protein [Candidatus Protochlamydia sp.]
MGLVSSTGKVIQSIRYLTDSQGGTLAIQEQLLEGFRELTRLADSLTVKGIGIGVAGQIDMDNRKVIFAPNLPGWQEVQLGENLERETGLPVHLINDVRAITLGEWIFGAGVGYKNLVCVIIGTGIGGGIVCNGSLQAGCSNTFGEIGHMTIDFRGPVCTCGNRGCLEVYAGGWGIARQAKDSIGFYGEAGKFLLEEANGDKEAITAKTVVSAYRKNDKLAQIMIERVKTTLVAGCANLINAFNPCCLILGGGVIVGLPELIPWVRMGVKDFALKASAGNLKVVEAKLGKEGGVIGAAVFAMQKLK